MMVNKFYYFINIAARNPRVQSPKPIFDPRFGTSPVK